MVIEFSFADLHAAVGQPWQIGKEEIEGLALQVRQKSAAEQLSFSLPTAL